MAPDFDTGEPEVADAFDVHLLPIGRVVGFPADRMADEAALSAAVLRRIGGQAVAPVFTGDEATSLTEVDETLARWAGRRDEGDRPSALLWFGHGAATAMGSVLYVPGSGNRKANAVMTPDMVAHHIYAEHRNREHDDRRWALVVVEACNSTYFVEDVARRFSGTGRPRTRSLLLIGTGKAAGQGYLGTFRRIFEDYLNSLSSHDRIFTLSNLRDRFKGNGYSAELVGDQTYAELRLELRDRVPLPGAVTVADQRRLQHEFDSSPTTAPRVPDSDETGFLEAVPGFAGRTGDLRAVAEWSASPAGPSVLVITGAPGAGKSALLGEVLRRARDVAGAPGGSRSADATVVPGLPGVVAVLPLTGSTPADVVRRLAHVLGVEVEEVGGVSAGGEPVEALRRRLDELVRGTGELGAGGPAQAVIVADALDEARDPVRIASLLRDLTEILGVRLLIGTRPSTPLPIPLADGTTTDGDRVDLLDVLGSGTPRTRVRVLEPDPTASREYTEESVRRFLAEHPVGDDEWTDAVVHTVAAAVEAHVHAGSWQFLQVALVVQEIEQRPDVLHPGPDSRAALAQLLERDQTGLFGAAVARITAGMPVAGPLLRALAYAHGRGLPRADGIWARAASGIDGIDVPVDDEQLELFLNRAAAYVLLDGEHNRSVYRLAHRTYAEQLLGDGTSDRRFSMLISLLDLADAQARTGGRLSPHLAARLAEYTADCGLRGWDALARRPAVLDLLPVPSLSALALAPRPDTGATPFTLPIEVLGTVASAHLIEGSEAHDRPGLRQLGGLRATGRLHATGTDAAWEVCWGRLRRVPPHLQLGGTDGAVTALTAHPAATWLATGSLDGTIVVWRPWREHHPTAFLRGHGSPVTTLAAFVAGAGAGPEDERGVPGLLVAAHDDRTIRLWDVEAEHAVPRTTSTPEVVRLAVALPDGTQRFTIAGDGGYLALLAPDGTRPHHVEPLNSSDVVGLALATEQEAAPLVVAAHRSGQLGLWDVAGAVPVLVHQLSARTALVGLTCLTDREGTRRLVTATADGRLLCWRVESRSGARTMVADSAQGVLADHYSDTRIRDDRNAVPVAVPTTGGDGVLVVGDDQGALYVLRPGQATEALPTGTRGITAIGVLRGPQGGSVLAVAAERDPGVHFWDPTTPADQGTRYPAPRSTVTGMRQHVLGDGTEALLVLEESASGTLVRVLDAADGEELAEPAPPGTVVSPAPHGFSDGGTTDPATAGDLHTRIVGCVLLDGPTGLAALGGVKATAGREGSVVLWRHDRDPGWDPRHVVRLGSPCLGLVALTGQRLAVATDDGIVVLRIAPAGAAVVDSRGTEQARG